MADSESANAGPICIGSDDESQEDAAWDKALSTPRSIAHRKRPRLPGSFADPFICLLLVQQGADMHEVSDVSVSLGEGRGPVAPRNMFTRAAGKGGKAQPGDEAKLQLSTKLGMWTVPITAISKMEIRSNGRMVVLGLSEAAALGDLLALNGQRLEDPARQKEREMANSSDACCQAFGLVPLAAEVKAFTDTMSSWVPHVKMLRVPSSKASTSYMVKLDGIPLTANDLRVLKAQQCLNDSALDFYLHLVLLLTAPAELRDVIYLASTFFFQKLTSGGVASGEEGWENVQRWTHRLPHGAMAHKYIFVPVNELNVHWWLAVICNPINAVLDDDTGRHRPANAGETPRIVLLDSADDPPPKEIAVNFLRGYVWREACERFQEAGRSRIRSSEEAMKQMKAYYAQVPLQENGYDCGIFIIEYLTRLMTSPPSLKGLGLAKHTHWFQQAVVSHRRKQLHSIAVMLLKRAHQRREHDVRVLLEDQVLYDAVLKGLTDRPPKSRESSSMPTTTSSGNGWTSSPTRSYYAPSAYAQDTAPLAATADSGNKRSFCATPETPQPAQSLKRR